MLNLEEDLLITEEDFAAMREAPPHDPRDLGSYLDFLEAVGAFESGESPRIPMRRRFDCRIEWARGEPGPPPLVAYFLYTRLISMNS